MTGRPGPVPERAWPSGRLHVPATREEQVRHAAIILIATGLDQQPGDPWGVAHDVAEALGLLPDAPVKPPRQASGWQRQKAREARKAAGT